MLQVIGKGCRKYTLLLLKYKSEYKNSDSKVAFQFVQTCLPEIKLFEHQLVSLAEEERLQRITDDKSTPLKLVR